MAAISVCVEQGANIQDINNGLENIMVPGRNELVANSKNLNIIIDYAHSPESLKSILDTTKAYTKGKLICLFGCGGNRDKRKRPMMGEISGNIADFTIITSDNPRGEVPEDIIDQIEVGINKTKGQYIKITNRKEAIEYAINMATINDTILLAGKGHETYQEINNVKHPLDERIIIKEIFGQ